MNKAAPKIAIVEDDELLLYGLGEKLNAEGKDLFGKERKTETSKKTSYDDLYGGHAMGTQITGQTIGQQPVIGLDIPVEEKEKILDLKVGWDDEE